MEKVKRAYDNPYPSVTTILGVIASKGLEEWYKRTPYHVIQEKMKKGREIGGSVHQAIQDHIELKEIRVETVYPTEVMTALKSFMLFKAEHPEIVLKCAEKMLTSKVYKFNGTLDVEGSIQEVPAIGDWKCVEAKDKEKPGIWSNYKIQLSAYIYLNNEVYGTKIEKGFSVPIAKDKITYNLCEMDKEEIQDCFNEAFLPALKIYNQLRKMEKNYA